MLVYHFLEERWAIKSLEKQRLKVSRFSDLNDPFELLSVSLKEKSDRNEFYELKQQVDSELSVLCFSKDWSNTVLWSHYGDKHKGMVLGFDIPDAHAKEVLYTEKRLEQDLFSEFTSGSEDRGLKLLTTKFAHWEYEEEVRLLVKLEDTLKCSCNNFISYCDALKLREVIIGPRCKRSSNEIKSIRAVQKLNPEIIKSRLAFQSFSVVKDCRY